MTASPFIKTWPPIWFRTQPHQRSPDSLVRTAILTAPAGERLKGLQPMGSEEHRQSVDSITTKWAMLAAICASPLFIVFAYFGDPGRGQAAWVSAGVIAIAARFWWEFKGRIWYWLMLAVIVLLHVAVILLIPWSFKQLSYIALLPVGLLDFCVAYSIIRLAAKIFGENKSATEANLFH